jgi:CBS domain containing-hemolysin-like protein
MEVAKSTSNEIYETKGEARFWFLVWLLSLLVIAFTYLSPFFFEWISARIFIRELHSIWDWGFSWNRFWKSLVAPHCFFSGFVSVFLLKTQMEADWQSVIKAIISL